MSANQVDAALVGQFYAERNREYPLQIPVVSVGRSNGNTFRIRDDRVASHHIRIYLEDERYILEVMAEDPVTSLNGEVVAAGTECTLNDGDVIGLADLEFQFTTGGDDGVLSRLQVVAGVHRGKTFRIERPCASVGRATDNDVQFPDRSVSRHHCRIRREEDRWTIEDLESTNGTLVNGTPVRRAARLFHGDEIVVGFSRFVFQDGGRPLVVPMQPDSLPPRN